MPSFDLIVAGAGMVGAACARAAAQAGLRVAVVEPGAIGGGATAEGMGHLVALDDNPAGFALAQRSLELWEALSGQAETEFHRCGTLWVAASDTDMAYLRSKAERMSASGRAAELLDGPALREAEPALAHDLVGALRVAAEAVVYPPRIALWMLQQVVANKGVICHGRRVVALQGRGTRLDDGTQLNGPVLIACACDTPRLLPELEIRARRGHLAITRRYPGWLRHQVVEAGYAAGAHGDAGQTLACNVQPRPNGQLLIGSSREYGQTGRAVLRSLQARMLQRCLRFLPGLEELQVIRSWTGFRPATPDGLPYIGALPWRPGVWVAAGHEGLGITTAPGTAELFLDLLLGRATRLAAEPFSPTRVLT